MKLNSKGIRRDGHKKTCDCDEIIDFLVLRNKENQANACVLDAVVALVDLDYLCHLKKNMMSMGQPWHGACVIVAAEKWV